MRSVRSGTVREPGAAMVEFAIVALLLFMLVFGIIDFGWLFGQHIEVRHGAREASRLVAVSQSPYDSTGAIVSETCDRMNLSSGVALVSLSGAGGSVGDSATVEVEANYDSLTGFFPFLNGITLRTTLKTRLEQPPTWTDAVDVVCP